MKKAFFSFKFEDYWRVQQVRNIGAISNESVIEKNDWETLKRQSDAAISNWIEKNISNCDVVIVLITSKTITSRWVKYEIAYAKSIGKKVYGVKIHNLKDQFNNTAMEGDISGWGFSVEQFNPNSWDAYNSIKKYIENL